MKGMWNGCWGQRLFVVRQVAASDAGLLGATWSCGHSSHQPSGSCQPTTSDNQSLLISHSLYILATCDKDPLSHQEPVQVFHNPRCAVEMRLKAFLSRPNNEKQWTIWCRNNFHIFFGNYLQYSPPFILKFCCLTYPRRKMKTKEEKEKERKKAWRSKKEGRQRNRKKMEVYTAV